MTNPLPDDVLAEVQALQMRALGLVNKTDKRFHSAISEIADSCEKYMTSEEEPWSRYRKTVRWDNVREEFEARLSKFEKNIVFRHKVEEDLDAGIVNVQKNDNSYLTRGLHTMMTGGYAVEAVDGGIVVAGEPTEVVQYMDEHFVRHPFTAILYADKVVFIERNKSQMDSDLPTTKYRTPVIPSNELSKLFGEATDEFNEVIRMAEDAIAQHEVLMFGAEGERRTKAPNTDIREIPKDALDKFQEAIALLPAELKSNATIMNTLVSVTVPAPCDPCFNLVGDDCIYMCDDGQICEDGKCVDEPSDKDDDDSEDNEDQPPGPPPPDGNGGGNEPPCETQMRQSIEDGRMLRLDAFDIVDANAGNSDGFRWTISGHSQSVTSQILSNSDHVVKKRILKMSGSTLREMKMGGVPEGWTKNWTLPRFAQKRFGKGLADRIPSITADSVPVAINFLPSDKKPNQTPPSDYHFWKDEADNLYIESYQEWDGYYEVCLAYPPLSKNAYNWGGLLNSQTTFDSLSGVPALPALDADAIKGADAVIAKRGYSASDSIGKVMTDMVPWMMSWGCDEIVREGSTENMAEKYCDLSMGACRHRSFVAFLVLNRLGLPTRFIGSTCHAWPEIWFSDEERWVQIDLGGCNPNSDPGCPPCMYPDPWGDKGDCLMKECPEGQDCNPMSDRCEPPCPEGMHWNPRSKECESCPENMVWTGNDCECDPSAYYTHPDSGECLPIPECHDSQIWNGSECICPPGTVWSDDEQSCIPIADDDSDESSDDDSEGGGGKADDYDKMCQRALNDVNAYWDPVAQECRVRENTEHEPVADEPEIEAVEVVVREAYISKAGGDRWYPDESGGAAPPAEYDAITLKPRSFSFGHHGNVNLREGSLEALKEWIESITNGAVDMTLIQRTVESREGDPTYMLGCRAGDDEEAWNTFINEVVPKLKLNWLFVNAMDTVVVFKLEGND